jgi:hypothetical protein
MKHLNHYIEYIQEVNLKENKLYIENGDFESGEIAWNYEIDITQPWSQLQKNQLNQQQFNEQYVQILNSLNGTECWREMMPLATKLSTLVDPYQSEGLYNQIYDVADKYLIKIKT